VLIFGKVTNSGLSTSIHNSLTFKVGTATAFLHVIHAVDYKRYWKKTGRVVGKTYVSGSGKTCGLYTSADVTARPRKIIHHLFHHRRPVERMLINMKMRISTVLC